MRYEFKLDSVEHLLDSIPMPYTQLKDKVIVQTKEWGQSKVLINMFITRHDLNIYDDYTTTKEASPCVI